MVDFNSLELLHNHLEENATAYKYPHQIGDLFIQLRDFSQKGNKADEAKKAQWEVDFFNFRLEKGEALPVFEGSDEKGLAVGYPTFSKFEEDKYSYLIERLNNTNSSLLKARYAHILWCSPKKHTKYAKLAVDSYLKLIDIYERKGKKTPKEHFGLGSV